MGIENKEISIILNDQTIKTEIRNNILETLNEFRSKLDASIDNIRLKEAIIMSLSKILARYFSVKKQNIESVRVVDKNENSENQKDLTLEEWDSKLRELLSELRREVETNFPNLWDSLEFQLSIKNILHIDNCTLPFAGIILGAPSSMKTLGIELFRESPNTFYSDNFSPKSFVSHATSVKREDLKDVDLLPKIRGKLFLTPELSPVFAKKDEDLKELLGIWIRILDGKGYESDSGTQGHRGYTGEFMFTWIGAAVEIPRGVHKLLSALGPKLYFYRIPKIKKSENELLKQITGIQFNDKSLKVKVALQSYLNWFDLYPIKKVVVTSNESNDEEKNQKNNSPLKIDWNESKDEEKAIRIIIRLANLLAPLRGTLQTWETRDSQGAEYAYSYPIIEDPERAITQLRNLARGHAVLFGRNYITIEDVSLIIKVVLSTASIERVKVLDLLLNVGGILATSKISDSLNISNSTAKRTMTEFKGLGVVDMINGEHQNSEITIQLKKEFSWFLSDEFKKLRDNFTLDYESIEKKKSGLNRSGVLQENILPYESDLLDNHNITEYASFKCYYCDYFIFTSKKEYESHVIKGHPGKPAYPSKTEIEKYNLSPQRRTWEV